MRAQLHRLSLLVALGILVTACGGKAPESAADAKAPAAGAAPAAIDTDAEKVVNVYNWSDYIEPTVIEAFEKETGIKVNYEVMDSNELLETKLLAGVPATTWWFRRHRSWRARSRPASSRSSTSPAAQLKNLDPEI